MCIYRIFIRPRAVLSLPFTLITLYSLYLLWENNYALIL